MSHLHLDYPCFEKLMDSDEATFQTTLDERSAFERSKPICCRLELIHYNFLLFSMVEDYSIRHHIKYNSISTISFMPYMSGRTETVENKLSDMLPSSAALVFSGWSCTWTHSFGILTSLLSDSSGGSETGLRTFFQLEDDSSLSTKDHYQFMLRILEYYGKAWKNVSCTAGEDCAEKEAIARPAKVSMVGCASRRKNLAMGMYLQEDEIPVEKNNKLRQR